MATTILQYLNIATRTLSETCIKTWGVSLMSIQNNSLVRGAYMYSMHANDDDATIFRRRRQQQGVDEPRAVAGGQHSTPHRRFIDLLPLRSNISKQEMRHHAYFHIYYNKFVIHVVKFI